MKIIRTILVCSITLIVFVSFYVVLANGYNWPAVFFGDILGLDWRSQFNIDFSLHIILLAVWICWREGFSGKGYFFGFLCITMGGLFNFPYLLIATFKAQGNPKALLMGNQSLQ